jgi:putative transposase
MCGLLAYRWDGRRSEVVFQTTAGSYNDRKVERFLRNLRCAFPRRRVVLIWDRLQAHRSRHMRAYLVQQRRWLETVQLPSYAPDLNPVEPLWAYLKGGDLANRTQGNLKVMARIARRSIRRVRKNPHLLEGFLRNTGLSF